MERSVIASEERRCARGGGGAETRKVGCSSGLGGRGLVSRSVDCREFRLEGVSENIERLEKYSYSGRWVGGAPMDLRCWRLRCVRL